MVIKLNDIHKSYGKVKALAGVTLETSAKAIGLLGPNGAGKTTLLKTLLGLVKIDQGRGEVFGFDISTQQLLLRQQVGYMPEIDCYISFMDGVSYVAYTGELAGMTRADAKKRAHDVLDYVGLGETRYRQIETYSTGMKQRLKLAQALVHSPRLLLLDEPTSGLDPVGRDNILELINDLAHKHHINILFSSHILPDIESVCEWIIIIGRGKILANDSLDRLKNPSKKYYEIHFAGENSSEVIQNLQSVGYTVEKGPNELVKISLPDDENSLREIFKIASEKKVQVRHLTRSKNTLEEIFLKAVEEQS